MGKGRKRRKNITREPNGRASRKGQDRTPLDSRPSDWVAEQYRRFGSYYNSAIGRAYASGLLGDGNQAKDRYDKARKFASLYRRMIGGDRYRCALDNSPRGGSGEYSPTQQEADDQQWLIINMARIDLIGTRPFFDQLISHRFTDYGPSWLDAILSAKNPDRRDTMVLDAAIMAIDAIGHAKGVRIVLRDVA